MLLPHPLDCQYCRPKLTDWAQHDIKLNRIGKKAVLHAIFPRVRTCFAVSRILSSLSFSLSSKNQPTWELQHQENSRGAQTVHSHLIITVITTEKTTNLNTEKRSFKISFEGTTVIRQTHFCGPSDGHVIQQWQVTFGAASGLLHEKGSKKKGRGSGTQSFFKNNPRTKGISQGSISKKSHHLNQGHAEDQVKI